MEFLTVWKLRSSYSFRKVKISSNCGEEFFFLELKIRHEIQSHFITLTVTFSRHGNVDVEKMDKIFLRPAIEAKFIRSLFFNYTF